MTRNPEVLIAGAGPVGLFAALCLALRDVPVAIVDHEPRIAGHSYACALHPGTLKLLHEHGLATEAMRAGRSLHSLAFYEGRSRQAEVHFTDLPVEFPFVLVLPQNTLEDLLERELLNNAGVHVRWNHRLSALRNEPDKVLTTIETLVEPTPGYILPESARLVQSRVEEDFRFLVGADGQNSLVRKQLGIGYEALGEGEAFVVYEFETDADLPHEVRVVLNGKTTNVMWPLADNRCRWSFQLTPSEVLGETKSRWPFASKPVEMENALVHHARKLLNERAPWFEGEVKDIEWWVGGYFERRLATRFGRDRCWLAGDAAHRTGPVGVQSLNVGLKEAADLANTMSGVLREGAPLSDLEKYGATHHKEWVGMLKPAALLKPAFAESFMPVNPWVAHHRERILPCLPASGDELDALLHQIGLRPLRAADLPLSAPAFS